MLVIFLLSIGLTSAFIGDSNKEIPEHKYQFIWIHLGRDVENPIYRAKVLEYLEDGKITNREYELLERAKIEDSINKIRAEINKNPGTRMP